MNRSLNLLGVALVCMTLAWGPRTSAQAPQPTAEDQSERFITLTFPGGTLEEYVQAVSKAASARATHASTIRTSRSDSLTLVTSTFAAFVER